MTAVAGTAPRAPSARLFIALAIIVPAILAGLALLLSGEYARAERERQDQLVSADLTAAALGVRAAMRQAETAQRGYIVTRDRRFLAPYQPARRAAFDQLVRYHRLTSDAAVREIVAAKFAEMDQVLALGRDGAWERAVLRIADGEGLALMRRIEGLMQVRMDDSGVQARQSLARYLDRSQAIQRSAWTLMILLTLVLLIGLIVLWRLRRERWAAAVDAYTAATRHRTILDSTSDAIVILNPSGSIEQANAATFRMLGYTPDALERRDVSRILDIADGEGTFHERVGVVGDTLTASVLADRTALASDGRRVPVDVSLGLMALPDGLHVVASIRDVSERKAVERMKDDFVATVSHELRTPLTSVVGSLGLLRAGTAGPLPDAARELVTIAENNARRLIRLTNDILDLEKLHSGSMTFEFDELDLSSVATETADAYRATAEARAIRIVVDANDRPLAVRGDRQRLLQAAGNLLSNSIRHAPDDSCVTISTREVDGRTVLRVSDQGHGVPLEFRGRIFDRFGQVPSQKTAGTGLGLAIVREIIGSHGGSVWYEDAPGGGASFAFAIDRLRRTRSDTLILLSQDAETIARIGAMVREDGFRLEAVSTIEAIEQAARLRLRPALFLFDLDMALGSDADIRGWLDRDPDLGGVPCAIVSHATLECAAALPVDVVGWFSKPIDEMAMRSLLQDARIRMCTPGNRVVLLVDDDRDLTAVMVVAMQGQGELLTACDLASARRLLRARTPDIVILDLALPDGSGVDLLPDLVDQKGRPIPVVVHSAQAVSHDLVARAAAVVTKSRTGLPGLRSIIRSIVDDAVERD